MLLLYSFSIFVSALLLFLVQPMLAKQVLPYLGGAPAVWNTTMVFFQAALLCGYSYAHGLVRFTSVKKSAFIHATIILLSLSLLPIALQPADSLDTIQQPIRWVLVTLAMSVGIPFFLLSANAPLLQRWFAQSNHKAAKNPYLLYSASNLGSFIALLGFPLVLERFFPSDTQMQFWSYGYGLFTALLVLCAFLIVRYGAEPSEEKAALPQGQASSPDMRQWGLWILLAFIPSSLMLGVTSYITTDIAAMPMLWVIPLALYLLSFVIVFGSSRQFGHQQIWTIFLIVVLGCIFFKMKGTTWVFPLHLVFFFVMAIIFHGLLEQRKPHPSYLTSFYLAMSIGGVLGGIFNAMIAPAIFHSVAEYPLTVALGLTVHIALTSGQKVTRAEFAYGMKIALGMVVAMAVFHMIFSELQQLGVEVNILGQLLFMLAVASAVCLLLCHQLWQYVVVMAIAGAAGVNAFQASQNIYFQERNFFGVSIVQYIEKENVMTYMHGTTKHGVQSVDKAKALEPVSYYSPLIEVYDLPHIKNSQAPSMMIGMGVGTTACYGQEGQKFDFIEIDPIVIDIATNYDFFSYMTDCPPEKRIILGDGRLKMTEQPDRYYQVIVADAYSSDSLPIHLITKEAVEIYMNKLRDDGILAFNISNRHLNLKQPLANIAESLGMVAAHGRFEAQEEHPLVFPSDWIVMTKEPVLIAPLINSGHWTVLSADDTPVWTDQYSNIIPILRILE